MYHAPIQIINLRQGLQPCPICILLELVCAETGTAQGSSQPTASHLSFNSRNRSNHGASVRCLSRVNEISQIIHLIFTACFNKQVRRAQTHYRVSEHISTRPGRAVRCRKDVRARCNCSSLPSSTATLCRALTLTPREGVPVSNDRRFKTRLHAECVIAA